MVAVIVGGILCIIVGVIGLMVMPLRSESTLSGKPAATPAGFEVVVQSIIVPSDAGDRQEGSSISDQSIAFSTSSPEDMKVATPILTLPLQAMLSGYEGHRQERSLNCEFRSASDLAGYYGYAISWEELFMAVGHDPGGNPRQGFVGRSIDDPSGGIYPVGYGVYAEAVARGMQKLGIQAKAHEQCTIEWVRRQIAQGTPVVVWVTSDMRPAEVVHWKASDGSDVVGVRGEHTMTIIGYDPQQIWAFDPAEGQTRTFSWEDFSLSWSYLGYMALTVDGEPCP